MWHLERSEEKSPHTSLARPSAAYLRIVPTVFSADRPYPLLRFNTEDSAGGGLLGGYRGGAEDTILGNAVSAPLRASAGRKTQKKNNLRLGKGVQYWLGIRKRSQTSTATGGTVNLVDASNATGEPLSPAVPRRSGGFLLILCMTAVPPL